MDTGDGLIIDAEVDDDELIPNDHDDIVVDDSGDGDRASEVFGRPLGPNGPLGAGLMSLEDAVAAQAEMRHAIARMPAQRALPRGRS